MISSEVQRTLVKSPPELWTELSDPDSLARHLGALGEIRITRAEAEKRVDWEAERTTGSILIKPSGWGTKVTLSVTRELPPPEAAPADTPAPEEIAAAGDGEPSSDDVAADGAVSSDAVADTERSTDAVHATQGAGQAAELEAEAIAEPPAEAIAEPSAEAERVVDSPADESPQGAAAVNGMAEALPESETAANATAETAAQSTPRVDTTAALPPEAESGPAEPASEAAGDLGSATEPRRGFLARLFGRRRRATAPPAAPEPQNEQHPRTAKAEPPSDATEPARAASAIESLQARFQPEPAPSATQPVEYAAAEPATDTREHVGPALTPDVEDSCGADNEDAPGTETGPAATAEQVHEHRAEEPAVDLAAELRAAEEVAAEEVTALLTAVLDRLGAAHHRPFSRA